ncbi:hypothetical protein OROGR_005463 [Orobanche gracilis]
MCIISRIYGPKIIESSIIIFKSKQHHLFSMAEDMAPRETTPNTESHNQAQDALNTPASGSGAPNQQQLLSGLTTLLQGATITPQGNNQARVINQFNKFKPPTFLGREGPVAIEEWLLNLESIFDYMACTDEQKVSCAVFQLKEDARTWWNGSWRLRTEDERKMLSWEGFKEIVLDKYYPQAYKFTYIRDILSEFSINFVVSVSICKHNYCLPFLEVPSNVAEHIPLQLIGHRQIALTSGHYNDVRVYRLQIRRLCSKLYSVVRARKILYYTGSQWNQLYGYLDEWSAYKPLLEDYDTIHHRRDPQHAIANI